MLYCKHNFDREGSYGHRLDTNQPKHNDATVYFVVLQDRYQLLVEAQDGGAPVRRTATALVHVKVKDDNDNTPQFSSSSYRFRVLEGKQAGTYIGELSLEIDIPDCMLNTVYDFHPLWLKFVARTQNGGRTHLLWP